jgi:hypothetical protein
MFGVSQTARNFDGKYCSARLRYSNDDIALAPVYESTSVPFKGIKRVS